MCGEGGDPFLSNEFFRATSWFERHGEIEATGCRVRRTGDEPEEGIKPDMRHKITLLGDFMQYLTITRSLVGLEFGCLVFLNLVSAMVESVGILLFVPFLEQLAPISAPSGKPRGLLSPVL